MGRSNKGGGPEGSDARYHGWHDRKDTFGNPKRSDTGDAVRYVPTEAEQRELDVKRTAAIRERHNALNAQASEILGRVMPTAQYDQEKDRINIGGAGNGPPASQIKLCMEKLGVTGAGIKGGNKIVTLSVEGYLELCQKLEQSPKDIVPQQRLEAANDVLSKKRADGGHRR